MNDFIGNDLCNEIIAQYISEVKETKGDEFTEDDINLAELERRTGISRGRLRRFKKNGFVWVQHGRTGQRSVNTVLSGYTSVLDNLLSLGITNSMVCLERLTELGFTGSLSTIKRYISAHRNLIPVKRQTVASQGNRGRRYKTTPGETYQMDWGFTNAIDPNGKESRIACFAIICHHCGLIYVEFFPNAKQESLFIGMLHAFYLMGIPKYILTDNMKSVVNKRDLDGRPIWNTEYEAFMNIVGFKTKLCKPRHPFTKGKVERLIRYVKDNFLAGRVFQDISDLNEQVLVWSNKHNSRYHKEVDDVPDLMHTSKCANVVVPLREDAEILLYLFPLRRISFDGFVCYEGRRFGVPYSYVGKNARVCRKRNTLEIYSEDMNELLVSHTVTWSRLDSYCKDQFSEQLIPEELPTAPVKTLIQRVAVTTDTPKGFEKFDFREEVVL